MNDRCWKIVGFGPQTVKVTLLLCVLACAATGCFWRRYPGRAAVHVDVLVGMAHKGVDLVGAGRFTAESLPELTYPLERAQAFAREAHARTGEPPPSLDAFDRLVAAYRALVDSTDRVRRERPGPAGAEALAAPLAAVDAAAAAVREALAAEGGRTP